MSELYTWLLRPDDLLPGAVLALAAGAGLLGAWLARISPMERSPWSAENWEK